MSSERHARLSRLFLKACDLEGEERRAFLDRACEGNPALREEVESLLVQDDPASANLKTGHERPCIVDLAAGSAAAPASIGPYHIRSRLGEGGMGEVFLAEQEQPLRRKVAIKIVRWGIGSKEVLARFEAERQAMAIMDHPGIAKVFDAGVTGDGRPYFVMEYVAGVPITVYGDSHNLDLRGRLDLFIQTCNAIQHAHQRGIIHRDIKPSNILVWESDGRPCVKIIDFGVAKAMHQRLTERTLFTRHGVLIGTPEYMSPEQAEASTTDVDTRSDIYSLGVVLYELLAGALPFDREALHNKAALEMLRIIREEEPPTLKTRVSGLGATAKEVACRRHTDVRSLMRQLRGDLEWITMRALEKDPRRRYASASELSADLQRHLDREPVLAGPHSTTYRVGRFVKRHKFGVSAAILLLLVALIGLSGTAGALIWRAHELAERNRALSAMGMARMATQFEAEGKYEGARWYLEKGLMGFEPDDWRASVLRRHLALVLEKLGNSEAALALLERDLEIMSRVTENQEPRISEARTLAVLAALHDRGGRDEQALELYERVIEMNREIYGPEYAEVASSLWNLGRFQYARGRAEEGDRALRQALDIRRARERKDSAAFAFYEARYHSLVGDEESAIAALRRAIERGLREPGRIMLEEDLRSLRLRSDFHAIVADLERRPPG